MGNLQVVEQTKRIVVLTFSDRLDAFNAPNARAEIDGLLADGAVNFVVDLTEVSFMDSAGVAVMVNLLKRSRQVGGDVRLVRPSNETAMRILRLTRFDQVFAMFATAGEAVNAF